MPFACYLDVTIVLVHDLGGVSLSHMPLDWNSATSRRLPSRNRLFYMRHREAQLLWSKCRYVPAACIIRHVFACYHPRRSPCAPLDTHFSLSPQSVTKSLAKTNDPLSGASSACEAEPSRQGYSVLTTDRQASSVAPSIDRILAPSTVPSSPTASSSSDMDIDVKAETPCEDQSRGIHWQDALEHVNLPSSPLDNNRRTLLYRVGLEEIGLSTRPKEQPFDHGSFEDCMREFLAGQELRGTWLSEERDFLTELFSPLSR